MGLHATAAAHAAAVHAVARRSALARAQNWGFFTLYLPGFEQPLYARPGTSDLQAFQAVFGRPHHAFDLGFEPRVIFDLGANVGYMAVDFALRYPGASIVAVEPEPANAALLRRNTSSVPGIQVVEGAVWPHATVLGLEDSGLGTWAFRVHEAPRARADVRAVTIPELMESAGVEVVDLLKVDIEGAELELLSEANDWLAHVRAVVVEFHDGFRQGCREVGEKALRDAGFELRDKLEENCLYVRPAGGDGRLPGWKERSSPDSARP
jgi:FkbM family methyltransferase